MRLSTQCCEHFTGRRASRPNPLRSVVKREGNLATREGAALPLPPEGDSPRAARFMGGDIPLGGDEAGRDRSPTRDPLFRISRNGCIRPSVWSVRARKTRSLNRVRWLRARDTSWCLYTTGIRSLVARIMAALNRVGQGLLTPSCRVLFVISCCQYSRQPPARRKTSSVGWEGIEGGGALEQDSPCRHEAHYSPGDDCGIGAETEGLNPER